MGGSRSSVTHQLASLVRYRPLAVPFRKTISFHVNKAAYKLQCRYVSGYAVRVMAAWGSDAAARLLARTMIAKDFPFAKDFH